MAEPREPVDDRLKQEMGRPDAFLDAALNESHVNVMVSNDHAKQRAIKQRHGQEQAARQQPD